MPRFDEMPRDRQREIARQGGIAAHLQRTGHEWASGHEAQEAGRAGGLARAKKQREACAMAQRSEGAVTEVVSGRSLT